VGLWVFFVRGGPQHNGGRLGGGVRGVFVEGCFCVCGGFYGLAKLDECVSRVVGARTKETALPAVRFLVVGWGVCCWAAGLLVFRQNIVFLGGWSWCLGIGMTRRV